MATLNCLGGSPWANAYNPNTDTFRIIDQAIPQMVTTQDNICSYCDSVYSGDLYNCPNCSAPKLKEVVEEVKLRKFYAEVVGTEFGAFILTDENNVLRIFQTEKGVSVGSAIVRVSKGCYTAQELAHTLNESVGFEGLSINFMGLDGRIAIRSAFAGKDSSFTLYAIEDNILPTIGILEGTYLGVEAVI